MRQWVVPFSWYQSGCRRSYLQGPQLKVQRPWTQIERGDTPQTGSYLWSSPLSLAGKSDFKVSRAGSSTGTLYGKGHTENSSNGTGCDSIHFACLWIPSHRPWFQSFKEIGVGKWMMNIGSTLQELIAKWNLLYYRAWWVVVLYIMLQEREYVMAVGIWNCNSKRMLAIPNSEVECCIACWVSYATPGLYFAESVTKVGNKSKPWLCRVSKL